jgi:hypothetical protein
MEVVVRTIRVGDPVQITDHPWMRSIITKRGRVMDIPLNWKGKPPKLRKDSIEGTIHTNTRLWVRLDGNDEVEYGVPFNCLMVVDSEADELDDEGAA